MSGFNVETVFSMAAKDMYVRECIQSSEGDAAGQEENAGKGGSGDARKQGGKGKEAVSLEKGQNKSLADKKK